MGESARLLPHLAAASRAVLGDEDFKKLPTTVRVAVAGQAGVSQNTVDRFLKGETVPRSEDLDRMITAVAAVAGLDWLDPWKATIARAEDARGGLEEFLSPAKPSEDQIRLEAEAAERDVDEAGGANGRGGPPASE